VNRPSPAKICLDQPKICVTPRVRWRRGHRVDQINLAGQPGCKRAYSITTTETAMRSIKPNAFLGQFTVPNLPWCLTVPGPLTGFGAVGETNGRPDRSLGIGAVLAMVCCQQTYQRACLSERRKHFQGMIRCFTNWLATSAMRAAIIKHAQRLRMAGVCSHRRHYRRPCTDERFRHARSAAIAFHGTFAALRLTSSIR
jgi:hypothetical protein